MLVAATVSISAFTVLGGGVEPSQNLAANAFSRRGPPITAYSLFIKGSLQDYSPKVFCIFWSVEASGSRPLSIAASASLTAPSITSALCC